MKGAVGSLNAAVAGSILLFEAVAQRDDIGPSDEPDPAPTGPPEPDPPPTTARKRKATKRPTPPSETPSSVDEDPDARDDALLPTEQAPPAAPTD